jgi:hypothetical protein
LASFFVLSGKAREARRGRTFPSSPLPGVHFFIYPESLYDLEAPTDFPSFHGQSSPTPHPTAYDHAG